MPHDGADPSRRSLEIHDLVVQRGRQVVLGPISLSVGPGELIALIGSNGAGKSTLVECVAGLLRSRSGSVSYGGTRINNLRAERVVRHGIVLVPEGRQLFLEQTVADNLLLGCYWRVRDKEYVAARLAEAYERFPVLKRKRRDPAGTLSGGEQQILALSRGLMSQPRILLLDEPSTGLAPLIVRDLVTHLEGLRDHGLGILLVEQIVGTALKAADRGYVMSRGAIVAHGPGNELLRSDALVGAYVGNPVREIGT